MNGIDYFSPDDLANLRGGVSAASGSAATGDQTAANISAAYKQAKDALAAKRIAPQVAPAVTPAETIAPVATAEAATNPTLGQRILNAKSTLSNVGNIALRGLGAAQALTGAAQGNTSNSADNVFNGAASVLSPGVGIAGNSLASVRDAILAHIVNSRQVGPDNIGPELQKQIASTGGLDNLLKKQTSPEAVAARAALPPVTTNAAPAPAPIVPSITPAAPLTDIPSGVPASGTGYIKNSSTGAVTQIGSPDGDSSGTAPATAAPRSIIPSGRGGGAFGSFLFPFLQNYASQAIGVAQQSRDYRHQQAQQAQDIEQKYKEGQIDAAQKTAAAHQLAATAAYMGATAKENPVKILQDPITGKPYVVNASNPSNPTVTQPAVQQVPTLQEFMRQAKLLPGNSERSDAELAQYYKRKYGG